MTPPPDIFADDPAPRLCDLPDVLDVEQAAAATRLGVNNVRAMVKDGRLPRVPESITGRRILIPRRAVERLLDEWSRGDAADSAGYSGCGE
jgi:excisionase family DNA binding protein